MTPTPTKHFTADDLDAFHTEALSSEMRLHFETCPDCRQLAALDREVLAMVNRLRSYEPRDGFADRVMARVQIAAPAPVPVLSFPKLTTRRRAALTAVAAGMLVSIAWSVANRSLLDGWLDGTGAALWNSGTALWQQTLAALTTAPWFEAVRQVSSTPVRLAAGALLAVGLYAGGLMALRRLVTPSSGTVSNAQA
jgi:hypothetical protein